MGNGEKRTQRWCFGGTAGINREIPATSNLLAHCSALCSQAGGARLQKKHLTGGGWAALLVGRTTKEWGRRGNTLGAKLDRDSKQHCTEQQPPDAATTGGIVDSNACCTLVLLCNRVERQNYRVCTGELHRFAPRSAFKLPQRNDMQQYKTLTMLVISVLKSHSCVAHKLIT